MTHFKSAALFTVFGFLLASLAGSLRAAPDQKQGMAIMSALVDSGGMLLGGAGAVSAAPLITGQYKVTFRRPLNSEDCVFTPQLFESGFAYVSFIEFSGTLTVNTRNAANSPTNLGFHLLVFCAR